MKFYTWTVKISVADTWVADGFDLTEDRLNDILQRELSYAYSTEVKGEIVKSPNADKIAKEQGYSSANTKKEMSKLYETL